MFLYLLFPPTYGSLCSPTSPDFKEYRYQEQIAYCTRNVSTERKNTICHRDGVDDRTAFTVDHIIPLSLGGSNDDDNLWCQHHSLNVTHVEFKTYQELRDGKITQQEAIDIILDAKFKKADQIGTIRFLDKN